MRPFSAGSLAKSSILAALALLALSFGATASGAGRSAPACGLTGGALADPADTQRCLADRYKPPKPKSGPPPTQSNAAPASNAGHDAMAASAPPSNAAPPPSPGS